MTVQWHKWRHPCSYNPVVPSSAAPLSPASSAMASAWLWASQTCTTSAPDHCSSSLEKHGRALVLEVGHAGSGTWCEKSHGCKSWVAISGFKGRDGIPQMVEAYLKKKVLLDEFITHTMPLERVNEAIQLMREGKWWVVLTLVMI